MFCIPPCIFQVSRVTSTTDSQQYYIYRLGPPQNLFLFFLFLLPSPGDCGSNFVLGDQLCFSWFSVKVPISCCTPATLADASLFTTTPTMGLFYLRSVKSTWQGDHPGNKTNPGTWKGWSYYYYYYWQQDKAPSNEWSCYVCVDNKLNALQGQNIELRFFYRPKKRAPQAKN